jgi:hypothetical protein
MIRIERHEEVRPGVWHYTVPSLGLAGQSRQPLLDACRQLRAIFGDTSVRAGVFRAGRAEADISCSVEWGAQHTVNEPPGRGRISFGKFSEFDRDAVAGASDIAEAAA